ncbi:MAG TPA: protein kinase [Tepidiformaceae bacterium]|nr:protein kinase [Tepidiformaceae bacterium]
MPLSKGTKLGTYHITGPLGAGGMGEVYRARDTRLGREVAIKVLPEAVAASPDRLARFEREARAVAGLNHPNIVTLHSVEEEEGVRFLTMELVDGQSLDHVVTSGGLPLSRVLELAIPLANALVAAHERGVVHRDLKPGNVMVTPDGWVKVLDFGLAKVAAEEGADPGATIGASAGPISGVGQVLGTVPYMAPEQIRGEPVDARSDLFALGIILYELATGRRPFTGESSADISSAILRDAPAPLLSVRSDLPRDLNRIVVRCLEKNPRDRFQTARDVYNELKYLEREGSAPPSPVSGGFTPSPPSAAPTPFPHVPATPTPGPRAATPAPSGPGSAASGFGPVSTNVPSIAVLPFINRSRNEEDEYFSDGLADELLSVLTKVRGLRVAARASSFQFRGMNEDLAVIGERLNVATLLDGSVRKSGNRVRISVQLVQAADRVQLWAETYDRSLDDIFAVQDDIAQSVVRELRTTLLGEAPDSKASSAAQAAIAAAGRGHGVQNPEAHRAYLQGKYFVDRVTEEDTAKGLRYLEEAVAIDPTLALAYAAISRAYSNAGSYGWEPVRVAYEKARKTALRALELAPDLPEAHIRLAAIQRVHDWDWKGAEASVRRALELDPSNAETLRAAGSIAHGSGRNEEARAYFLRSIELDPLVSAGYTGLAQVYRAMDRLPDSEQAMRKAMELSPQRLGASMMLTILLSDQGKHAEAVREAGREGAEWARLTALAYAYQKAGQTVECDKALRQLEEGHAVDSPYQIAAVHNAKGDVDAAFAWLNRAVEERDAGVAQVAVEPVFRNLHSDPRWKPLLKRINIV